MAAGDYIDRPAQGIAAEAGGDYALVNLDAFDEVDGQIGEGDARALGIERHTVEEIADRVAAHSVDREVEVAAYAALLADAYAGGAVDSLGQRLQGRRLRVDIDRIDGIGSLPERLFLALGCDGRGLEGHGILEHSPYSNRILSPQ